MSGHADSFDHADYGVSAEAVMEMVTREFGESASERAQAVCEAVASAASKMSLVGRDNWRDVVAMDLPDAVEVARLVRILSSDRGQAEAPAALAARLADVGTGAGLPGLLVAVLLPWLDVDLVDRKVTSGAFVTALAGAVGARNATFHVKLLGPYDFVTARALTDPGSLLKIAEKEIRPGGSVLVMTGPDMSSAESSAAAYGFRVRSVAGYSVGGGKGRSILVVDKVLNGGGSVESSVDRRGETA